MDAWRQIEAHEDGPTGFRGGHGPVHIENAVAKNPVSDAMIQAANSSGIQFVGDMNSTDADRIAVVASKTPRGFRRSAAATFLNRARKRKNVKLINYA